MKKILIISIVIILPLLALFGMYFYYSAEINKKIKVNEGLEFAVEKGSSVDAISSQLKELGLVRDPNVLKAYLYFHDDKSLQAGYYRIPEGEINLIELVEILQSGSFEQKLTFIEGWRVEEYVDHLRKIMGDEFADEFAASPYLKEGYMFPDTYIIAADYDPDNLASWMRNNFDQKAKTNKWEERAFEKGFTVEEVIIFASILEREMHIKKDRPIVAGILIKRYQNGWPLQADATIQYAKGNSQDWWPIVVRADLQGVNSLYNTYQHKELPPAPIANPSLSAVEAILNYEETPYWFYITGNDGTTHYAETLDQHNINVSRYIN